MRLRVCAEAFVFSLHTAVHNLKAENHLCPHVGGLGSVLNVSQVLFQPIGARIAQLLESLGDWLNREFVSWEKDFLWPPHADRLFLPGWCS
jgi:hypothetical protein